MSSLFSLASATVGGGHRNRAGYRIDRSVRLRSSASAYFARTFTTPTNNLKWTCSAWVKRGLLGTAQTILGGASSGTGQFPLYFTASDQIAFYDSDGVSTFYQIGTTAVFRDPSAWYHIVMVFDSANATQANRLILYINGVSQTLSSIGGSPGGLLPLNRPSYFNATSAANNIGCYFISSAANNPLDGYLTEINFIDGQALTPASFGETDAVTGVWKPKKYAGTYGTNGFYLNFSDNSAANAEAIGKDNSGNGNNWTPNNISVTAGVTYDSMLDVPTQWGDGGNGRGNYAVLNPVNVSGGGTTTITDGNLATSVGSTTTYGKVLGSVGMSTGKWYWEVLVTAVGGAGNIGIGDGTAPSGSFGLGGVAGELSYQSSGNKYTNNSSTAYGASYTTNDIIGVAYDADAGSITFYKNNTSQGAITGFSGTKYAAVGSGGGTNPQYAINFGQRPFTYTPPTGFKALNTLNLPEPTILKGNQYFDATTYTGQSTSLSVTNSGSMQPDFVWIKKRNGATDHNLTDAVRGTNKNLISNSTAAEDTTARLTSFDSGGFTLAGAFDNTNLSGSTYVGWQWKEGATQGFDIVTYTGTGVARTVAHSLGVAPSMMIVKNRTTAVAGAWPVYHQAIGATNYLFLDLTDAQSSVATPFNDTAPTSTVFSVDGGDRVNKSGNGIVAYLFAEVAGFSKFGSYTGNGSADGPFVFCGFRPRWIMFKKSSATDDWIIYDTERDAYNVASKNLYANGSFAEDSNTTNRAADILSNGFKIRSSGTYLNGSGATFIFAAFAEHPFKNALAR
jgi:hypothetical protein